MHYRVGTRGSKLALAQTNLVIDRLKEEYPKDSFEVVIIQTKGDRNQNISLDQMGTKGVFVEEIEAQLLQNEIQLAVHSMKDMPEDAAEGLTFSKAWSREDARDVLILKEAGSLMELKRNAVIGTGSKRRAYQLLQLRPDLEIVGIRGNIDTRIRKLQESAQLDGIVLAAAGLKRLGLEARITEYLEPEQVIPAPAQGVLALEVKADNRELLDKLNRLSDAKTELAVRAERGFLKQIGGDCHLPVGAFLSDNSDGTYTLRALFGDETGAQLARVQVSGVDTEVEHMVNNAVHIMRQKLLWEK